MKFKFNRKLDGALLTTALRTSGALIFANGFLGILIGDATWGNAAIVFAIGAAFIIGTSLTKKD